MIIKLGELNELAYEDLTLSINTNPFVRKVAFGLVQITKSADFLKLKSEFCNSKLESIKKHPDEWISNL